MNYHQIKQWLLNNSRHGENERFNNKFIHSHDLRYGSKYHYLVVDTLLSSPDFSRVWGTDISHWDGNVNLQVTKDKGASFVFIKGLDGTLQTNNFAANRQRAVAAGLPHAPYQWLYRNINVSAVAQAQAMKALLDKYPSVMPPVIDFEWTYWGGSQSNPNWIDLDLYVSELNRLGIKPILYTAKGYADMFGAMPSTLKAKFSGFWFANYGVSTPSLPLGFTTWDFWQFTSSGDASVYSPNDVKKLELDMNYFNGTKAQFEARFGVVSEPATGGTMRYQITNNSTASTRTIRSGPSVVFRSVDLLPPGGATEGDFMFPHDAANTTLQAFAGDKWIQIGANRWLAWIHKGVAYLNVTELPAQSTAPTISLPVTFTDENGVTWVTTFSGMMVKK